MTKSAIALFCLVMFGISSSFAQTDADREAIKRTALNYAEGWYEGNAEKMESALSPDLAKRIVRTNPQGQSGLGQMTAMAPVIAAPEGRVHFAGEHTSTWTGWMEGALESGERAAREVMSMDAAR